MYILLKHPQKNNYFIHFSQINSRQLFHFKATMFCVIIKEIIRNEEIPPKKEHFTDVF